MYILKKGLNRYGQQVHQYQQNEQSPIILAHGTHKARPWHITLEISVLVQGGHTTMITTIL